MIDGCWEWSKVVRWLGWVERYVLESRVCERSDLVGWEIAKFKCFDLDAGKERTTSRRTCHINTRHHSPCFVCSAINSIKVVAFAAHLTALRCTALR